MFFCDKAHFIVLKAYHLRHENSNDVHRHFSRRKSILTESFPTTNNVTCLSEVAENAPRTKTDRRHNPLL
jgi:hypothetical protein